MNEIEYNLKYIRKGKFIDLNSIREKIFDKDNIKIINFINVNDSIEKENKNDIPIKEKKNDNNNINNNKDKDYNSDTISYEGDDDEEQKPEIKLDNTTNKKELKTINSQERQISLDKNNSFYNKFYRDSASKLYYAPSISNKFLSSGNSKNFKQVPSYNVFTIEEKETNNNKDLLNKRTTSKFKNNNNQLEFPFYMKNMNPNNGFNNQMRMDSIGRSSRLTTNTSYRIESIKLGQKIIPCSSFS